MKKLGLVIVLVVCSSAFGENAVDANGGCVQQVANDSVASATLLNSVDAKTKDALEKLKNKQISRAESLAIRHEELDKFLRNCDAFEKRWGEFSCKVRDTETGKIAVLSQAPIKSSCDAIRKLRATGP